MEKRIAIVNPSVPHYREDFYRYIKERLACDVFTYEDMKSTSNRNFKESQLITKRLKSIKLKKFLLFNIFPLLSKQYQTLVLMWDFAQISTWLLLITKPLHRKKIILWGQGISVKRYLVEEVHPNRLLMAMLKLADGAWVYMEKETVQWKAVFPDKAIVALNNTISGVEKVLDTHYDVDELKGIKKKHNITEDILLIYCARFDNPYRRFDLLIQTIELLDPRKYGFIIIGEGAYKPDFLPYKNVYDYGKVYEKQLKDELFSIADIYYQPGWIGLSVVEAMAYGKPILTFKRSEAVLQCVEYHYIEHDRNGILLNDIEELKETLSKLMQRELIAMGMQSKRIVQDKLLMGNMVQNALSIL